MRTSDFDFDLPVKFIAQNPVFPRDHSKLLVFDTANNTILHKNFFDLKEILTKSDVLVLNESKVIPARIRFTINDNNKEIFLLEKLKEYHYKVLVKPGKFFNIGRIFHLGNLKVEVVKINDDGSRLIKFDKCKNLDYELEKFGEMPLPPYIKTSSAEFNQYQTVYANVKGSVAAPTAGLHFTDDLLSNLKEKGVEIEKIILHVGLGTFLPVSAENIKDHVMHNEKFEIDSKVAENLNKAKNTKKNIVAVGTTTVRVLESNFRNELFSPNIGETNIFISPGLYKWKTVDKLITNFHLPKSTLIMLVSSFLEYKGVNDPVKKIIELYEIAKSKNYRFYSFGDAMMII